MRSKAAVMGHAIHPMLVPFPIAGYTGALVGYAVYAGTDDQFWLNFAIVMNIAGVGGAILAALPGLADLATAIPKGNPAKRVGLIHAGLNVIALALFAITLGVYASHWDGPARSAVLGVTLSAIGVACLLGAGWFGWSLVQEHRVGIRTTEAEQRESEWQASGAAQRYPRG